VYNIDIFKTNFEIYFTDFNTHLNKSIWLLGWSWWRKPYPCGQVELGWLGRQRASE